MNPFRATIFLGTLIAGIAASATAEAAPRLLFRGCAYWGVPPFCLMMKATDGRTYQLVGTGPAFPVGHPVRVYANPGPDIGLCFAPVANVVTWKAGPPPPRC